jgi:hypothetical protein
VCAKSYRVAYEYDCNYRRHYERSKRVSTRGAAVLALTQVAGDPKWSKRP